MIDISKIRVGDKVTLVPLEVSNITHGQFQVRDNECNYAYYSADKIVAHHPKPRALEIGQQVLKMDDIYGAAVTGPWVVIGIHKRKVWLGSPEGERESYAQATRDELQHMDGTRVEGAQ